MRAPMPEEEAIETFRAAVEALLPQTDDAPGSADRGAAEFGVRQVEMFLPGFTDLAHALLTAYAMGVDPEKTFAQLSLDERRQVLEELLRGETQDMREVLSADPGLRARRDVQRSARRRVRGVGPRRLSRPVAGLPVVPEGRRVTGDPDVIVVGAGGCGPVVAKELAERGVKVLMLEAGPWLDPTATSRCSNTTCRG